MIIKTYTVAFPLLVRPKYQNDVLEVLQKEYSQLIIDIENYCDFGVYDSPAIVVTGLSTEEKAHEILAGIKQHFLSHKFSYQLDDTDLEIITNYWS